MMMMMMMMMMRHRLFLLAALTAIVIASEELVYQITKIVYENRTGVAEVHPAGNAINPENVVRDTGVKFHSGAVRDDREIGIWPES